MKKTHMLIIVAFLVALGAGFYLWQKNGTNSRAKAEAIRWAQQYHPSGGCTQALVPAVHKATGAKYTFPNGCLAPGWVAER